MAEQSRAAMWALDMAELTGCEETVWVNAETILPDQMPSGAALPLCFPQMEEREQLELLLRGGMAGHTMYAVPFAPGFTAPWIYHGLLLTDDPGMAHWFASYSAAVRSDGLNGNFLRVLHLAHSHGQALALLPQEHTLWALGADRTSLCNAVALGMAGYEGRWGNWLATPMCIHGSTAILTDRGTPHWLQIGADAKLWAIDPWAKEMPSCGLEQLFVEFPSVVSLCRVDWDTAVLCMAMAMQPPEGGNLSAEAWYYTGISHYLNQWSHTGDIIPCLPICCVGDSSQPGWEFHLNNAASSVSCPLGQLPGSARLNDSILVTAARNLLERLTKPDSGTLAAHLLAKLEALAAEKFYKSP